MESKKNLVQFFSIYCNIYDKIVLLDYDRITGTQFLDFRKSLNNKSVLLNGKNTVFRKAIQLKKDKNLDKLIPHLKNQVCFLFTNENFETISKLIKDNIVMAPPILNAKAEEDIIIYPHITRLDPSQISYVAVNNVVTKITRGAVEITNQVTLVDAGEKITSYKYKLMMKIGMKPTKQAFVLKGIYQNCQVLPPEVVEMTEDNMNILLQESIQNIACVSLASNYTTTASFSHEMINALKDVLAISIESNYSIPENELIFEYFKNPEKFNPKVLEEETDGDDTDTSGYNSLDYWYIFDESD
eukprot:gene7640-11962_t